MRLEIGRIEAAARQIDRTFLDSPQYVCPELSRELGCRLVLKVETMNPVRCFKGRGVDLALSRIDPADGPDQVVCASAGNLGQALAYCGRRRNLRVTVAASSKANRSKIDRMARLGAEMILVDGAIEEAIAAAAGFAARTGSYLIEDSRNVATCEGAGTIGLELAASGIPLDAVLVSLGAGAMATGLGHAVRCRCPSTAVLTVQPERAPAMTLSLRAGQAVDVAAPDTIADGVAGRYVLPEVLDDLWEVVTDALLVGEAAIRDAMRLLYRCSGLIVEPAAALGVAAILEHDPFGMSLHLPSPPPPHPCNDNDLGGRVGEREGADWSDYALEDRARFRGKTIATILCGANVGIGDFEGWVMRGG